MSSPRFATSKAFLVVATAIGTLAACGDKPAAQQGMGAVPVTVVTLQPTTVTLTRELPGRTTPFLIAEVRPQVDGIIEERLYTEGGSVKAGQPLYQIDDAHLPRSLCQREGGARARRGDAAQRDAQRAPLDGPRRHQRGEQAGRRERGGGAAAGGGRRRGRAGRRSSAGVVLGYARITAPISGRIGKSTVTQGALVTANQAAAARHDPAARPDLRRPDAVEHRAGSSCEGQLAAGAREERADLPVTILLEDGTQYPQEGKLAFSEVSVDPATGSFALRVVVPNPDQSCCRASTCARWCSMARAAGRHARAAAAHPRDPEGNTNAMVVDNDGKVEVRAVQREPDHRRPVARRGRPRRRATGSSSRACRRSSPAWRCSRPKRARARRPRRGRPPPRSPSGRAHGQ